MPAALLNLFSRYGYAVIFVGVLLENMGVPAPGHTVVLAGSFLAQQGSLDVGLVGVSAAISAFLGGCGGFWLGRHGGRRFVERHRKLLHLSVSRQLVIEEHFRRHDIKTILVGRFITGLQTVVAIFAGMSGMRWSRFLLYNAVGAVLWSVAFTALGYVFGQSWSMLHHWLHRAGLVALAVAVAIVFGFIARRWYLRRASKP